MAEKWRGPARTCAGPYDPAADEAARQKALATWREWIKKAPRPEN